MKKVLILIPYYFPGFRSGGPQQTIRNMVDIFGTEAMIYIYTQNHDLGTALPYSGIEVNKWIDCDNSKVMYVPSHEYCGKRLKEKYKTFDIIYSCGLFETNSIALLMIHRRLHNKIKKIYIAPMGVFSTSAIKTKMLKKKTFLLVFKKLGFFRDIIWSFTSRMELEDAKQLLGEQYILKNIIAEDLPRKIDFNKQLRHVDNYVQDRDTCKIIFLSRICSQKNLSSCLEILNYVYEKTIVFDIYGTIEDINYWNKCKDKFKGLPENVKIKYRGEVEPENVIDVFSKYDVFLFPTKGENFGHVIYESLASGCLPIISDTTPWRSLDGRRCGRVVAYGNIEQFQNSIKEIIALKNEELREFKINAVNYAKEKYMQAVNNSGYLNVILQNNDNFFGID